MICKGIYTVVFDYILFRKLLWGGRSRRFGLLKYRRLLEKFRTIVRGKTGSVMNTAHSNRWTGIGISNRYKDRGGEGGTSSMSSMCRFLALGDSGGGFLD